MRLAVILMLLSLDFATPSRAADEAQIRKDCTPDALLYCKAAILTYDRSAVIACMVANKAKLRPVCKRHIW